MNGDQRIIEVIKESLHELYVDYQHCDKNFDIYYSECDIQSVLFYLLCSKLPTELYELKSVIDRERKHGIGRRIYTEFPPDTKNERKKLDIAILGSKNGVYDLNAPLLAAVEIKFVYKAKGSFENDLSKLNDFGIEYPIFLYVDNRNFNSTLDAKFKSRKKNLPRVLIYYFNLDSLQIY